MLGHVRKIDDLRLTAFALRYILEAVDRPDNVSIAILDCLDVNERYAAQAIRPLNVHFLFAHRNTGPQHIGQEVTDEFRNPLYVIHVTAEKPK